MIHLLIYLVPTLNCPLIRFPFLVILDTSLTTTLDCSSNRVLLLEAGPRDSTLGSALLSWKIHMPAALMYNLCDDKFNWYLPVLC